MRRWLSCKKALSLQSNQNKVNANRARNTPFLALFYSLKAQLLHHCHFLWLICSAFYIIAKQTILDYLLLLPEPLHEHIAVDAPIGPLVSPFRCEILVVITSPFEISTIAVGA